MNARADDSSGDFPSVLVIGYGNELRGDDGAGRKLAEMVESWGMEGVQTLSVRQLTPDLAAEMKGRTCVLFADATEASEGNDDVRIRPLAVTETPTAGSHHCDPSELLALSAQLYGGAPDSFLLTIPGVNFAWSETLSTLGTTNLYVALAKARKLMDSQTLHSGKLL